MEVMFNCSFFSGDAERNTAYAVYKAPPLAFGLHFKLINQVLSIVLVCICEIFPSRLFLSTSSNDIYICHVGQ